MTQVRRASFTPFLPEQMYALVNDVMAYPEFLPWCVGARILESSESSMQAWLKVKRGRFDYAFTTKNRLTPGEAIELNLVDGPFRRLAGGWRFAAADGGCMIDFDIDFDFSSRVLGLALTAAFKPIADSLVDAFKTRAYAVYGD